MAQQRNSDELTITTSELGAMAARCISQSKEPSAVSMKIPVIKG